MKINKIDIEKLKGIIGKSIGDDNGNKLYGFAFDDNIEMIVSKINELTDAINKLNK